MFSTSDNKKILLTTRNVRLDSGHYATKYYSYQMFSQQQRLAGLISEIYAAEKVTELYGKT
jgi:hypothetical protein